MRGGCCMSRSAKSNKNLKKITVDDYKPNSEYGQLIDLYRRTSSAVRFQRKWRALKNKRLGLEKCDYVLKTEAPSDAEKNEHILARGKVYFHVEKENCTIYYRENEKIKTKAFKIDPNDLDLKKLKEMIDEKPIQRETEPALLMRIAVNKLHIKVDRGMADFLNPIQEPQDDAYKDHVKKILANKYEALDFSDQHFIRNLFKALRLQEITLNQMLYAQSIYEAKEWLHDYRFDGEQIHKFAFDDKNGPYQVVNSIPYATQANQDDFLRRLTKEEDKSYYTINFSKKAEWAFFLFGIRRFYAIESEWGLRYKDFLGKYIESSNFEDTKKEQLLINIKNQTNFSDLQAAVFEIGKSCLETTSEKIEFLIECTALFKIEKDEHYWPDLRTIKEGIKWLLSTVMADLQLNIQAEKYQIFLAALEDWNGSDIQLQNLFCEIVEILKERYLNNYQKTLDIKEFDTSVTLIALEIGVEGFSPSLVVSPDYLKSKSNSPVLSFVLTSTNALEQLMLAVHGKEAVRAMPIAGQLNVRIISAAFLLNKNAEKYFNERRLFLDDDRKIDNQVLRVTFFGNNYEYPENTARAVEVHHPDMAYTKNPHGYNCHDFLATFHDMGHLWITSENYKGFYFYEASLFTRKGICQESDFVMSKALWAIVDQDYRDAYLSRFSGFQGDEDARLKKHINGIIDAIDKLCDKSEDMLLLHLIDMIKHKEIWNGFLSSVSEDVRGPYPDFLSVVYNPKINSLFSPIRYL